MWGDKRYHSLDHEMKRIYGGKVYRLSLSSFCGCPNRDGCISRGGCIFCSAAGSGDFAQAPSEDIDRQIEKAKELVSGKLSSPPAGYIALSWTGLSPDIRRTTFQSFSTVPALKTG